MNCVRKNSVLISDDHGDGQLEWLEVKDVVGWLDGFVGLGCRASFFEAGYILQSFKGVTEQHTAVQDVNDINASSMWSELTCKT